MGARSHAGRACGLPAEMQTAPGLWEDQGPGQHTVGAHGSGCRGAAGAATPAQDRRQEGWPVHPEGLWLLQAGCEEAVGFPAVQTTAS